MPSIPVTPPRLALNLFWRTFALLALLLAAGVLAWQQTFKALEAEPKALEAAQQLAGLVNLSRVALSSTDAINRVAVVKSIARSEAGACGSVFRRSSASFSRMLPRHTRAQLRKKRWSWV